MKHRTLLRLVVVMTMFLAAPLHVFADSGGRLLLEEVFPNASGGRANHNLDSIGWSAYGGPEAVDLGGVTGRDLNSVMLAAAPGNPATGDGFLAFILGRDRPSFPAYAVVKTGLSLADPGEIDWRMQGASGGTFRVRLLVQVAGRWYASDVSDTKREYFEPATHGSSADFASGDEAAVTKRLVFVRAGLDWRVFKLEPGRLMELGDSAPADLPDSPVTGIGFHVLGGNTGRIDTLRVFARAPR